ncbi:ABC-type antimicrobial peptide transport system permease subunit [Chitinophaga skermanii]|uniref:ABC-type antimicrobial peptide transport system permease subunit n=1 Tax=Chitinophaga skermanii TaxID=331697 RepID=A0A327QPQ3_9BACT|nr:ABC transporter permease [Chitinophaga skermanii]RAJ06606.1 ABC-type antimicrobial peptide transport system permease subunit [Chitinophaga skermanii]
MIFFRHLFWSREDMLINYFKIALRNLVKGKMFSVINILGLMIGMAGALIILLWIYNELSYDRFHANQARLYEVYGENKVDGNLSTITASGENVGPAMEQEVPGVEITARYAEVSSILLSVGEKGFTNVNGSFVDPGFLSMFSFPAIMGGLEPLKDSRNIVVTATLAKKLFGNTNAVGKHIKLNQSDIFTVSAVLNDPPVNTRFQFEYLLPWTYLQQLGWSNNSWLSNNVSTFVLLKPNVPASEVDARIKDLTQRHANRADVWTHFLYPLKKWHLYTKFENGQPSGGRIETVRLFAIIAGFILFIACINFMNLSTASSDKRAKEVGVRKVVGAGREYLIGQFIIESTVTATIAGALALILAQFVLPAFNNLVGVQLSIPLDNLWFYIFFIAFTLFTGVLAGSYPAFYLASFKPISIFQKRFKNARTMFSPRKILVVTQFTFAVVLIIATIVVRNQINFAQQRELGYAKNDLIYVPFKGEIGQKYALLKQRLLSSGIATAVSKNAYGITEDFSKTWGLRWFSATPQDTNMAISTYSTEADMVTTTGMKLIAGRDININLHPSDSLAVMLNETAAAVMGFEQPIGAEILSYDRTKHYKVVGVVKDYIQGSPYSKVPPVVVFGPSANFGAMHIRFNPDQSTATNLAKTAAIFSEVNPDYPFEFQFVDQAYARRFYSEQHTQTLAAIFAGLSIFISCLGLFGLSAFVAASRVKEIGVRKVLGASEMNIAKLLSLDFVKLVFIAILVATPIAWFAMHRWLSDYQYKVHINWTVFFFAGLFALLIALVTVSFQAIKAAWANPIQNLRKD